LRRDLVDPAGLVVTTKLGIPDACRTALDRQAVQSCLGQLGFRDVITYHPASQYWRFQWTEAALFMVLAALLTTFAIVRTLRHDA
jgi:hypothetical protein